MIPITYITGDATRPKGEGIRIIAHICNDYGGWGAGFVLALSARSKEPEESYRSWFYAPRLPHGLDRDVPFELGEVKLTNYIDDDVYVANMIAQKKDKVDYVSLFNCLARLTDLVRVAGATVHMPRIGCGLGGGEWEEVQRLIQRTLCAYNVPVYVYDLPS